MRTSNEHNAHIGTDDSQFWRGKPTFWTGRTRSTDTKAIFKVSNIPARINRHTCQPHQHQRANARRLDQMARLDSEGLPG